MQSIVSARPAGPATLTMQSEATASIDLTISYQGKTQDVPAELVFGEADGTWCLKGLAQRE